MMERELCPLCGVPLEDEPGPVLEGVCPVHGVIGRLRGVDDHAPAGLLGQEADDGLSVWSGEFGDTLPVGTAGWRRVDAFEVGEGGEAARGFTVLDEEDSFRSSQKLRYPDGTTVEAQGMAHEGGRAVWTFEGLEPSHDALIIVQTDVMYAGGDLRLEAGGGSIVFPDFAPDRRYRARNRAVPVPGEWITDSRLEVSLGRLESTKDLSHFAVWIYQARTPVPEDFDDESLVDEPPAGEPAVGEPSVDEPLPVAVPVDAPAVDEEPAEPSANDDAYEPAVEADPAEAADDAVPGTSDAAADPPEDERVDLDEGDLGTVDAGPLDEGALAPEDERLETVDIPASALLDPPPQTPRPLAESVDEAPGVEVAEEAAAEEPAADGPAAEEPAAGEPAAAAVDAADAAPADEQPAIAQPSAPAARPAQSAPASEQKLVTITLADADHAHGMGHVHLASELRAGWRISRLECLPGPRGGWLVVLLER